MNEYFQYLTSEFEDRMKMLSDAVARGQCQTFEEYRFACGQLRGLEVACAVIKDLADKLESSDE